MFLPVTLQCTLKLAASGTFHVSKHTFALFLCLGDEAEKLWGFKRHVLLARFAYLSCSSIPTSNISLAVEYTNYFVVRMENLPFEALETSHFDCPNITNRRGKRMF